MSGRLSDVDHDLLDTAVAIDPGWTYDRAEMAKPLGLTGTYTVEVFGDDRWDFDVGLTPAVTSLDIMARAAQQFENPGDARFLGICARPRGLDGLILIEEDTYEERK